MRAFIFTTCLVCLPLSLTACGDSTPPATEAQTSVYELTDAFITAPLGERDMTMGGLSLKVQGLPATVISAEVTGIETIELHTMAMTDGKMKMRKVDSFGVSEDAPLTLKRGGDHLMLFGVGDTLKAGETVDLRVTVKNSAGDELTLMTEAEIRAVGE